MTEAPPAKTRVASQHLVECLKNDFALRQFA